jgi:branched-chain amino acid transport system substrate-binding protein
MNKRGFIVGLAIIAIVAVAVVLFLSNNDENSSPTQISDEDRTTVRLGTTISESGRLSRVASLYTDGRQLAIEHINANGGITVDGKSYPLELVQLDDQSDADLAVRLYDKLIVEDQVDYLLGPYSSGLVIPTSTIADKFKVPMVEGGGASRNIFNRGFKYIFGTLPTGPNYLQPAVKLFGDAGATTMALIFADDAFSTDVAEGTRDWAKEYGLEIVLDQKYGDGQTEFGALIAQLKTANPDVVMSANHIVESIAFVQQARSLGLESDMVFTVGVPTPDFLELGDVGEGVFGVSSWVGTQATSGNDFGTAADYAKTFQERFGYEADYHNANGTIEVLSYKYAIEEAGSLNRQDVRDALSTFSYESFYGPMAFDEAGMADKVQIVVQIQNGSAVSVGPGGVSEPIFGFSSATQ